MCISLNKSLWLAFEFFPEGSQGTSLGGLSQGLAWDMTIVSVFYSPATSPWILWFPYIKSPEWANLRQKVGYWFPGTEMARVKIEILLRERKMFWNWLQWWLHKLISYLKITERYTWNEWILFYVKYISIRLFFRRVRSSIQGTKDRIFKDKNKSAHFNSHSPQHLKIVQRGLFLQEDPFLSAVSLTTISMSEIYLCNRVKSDI